MHLSARCALVDIITAPRRFSERVQGAKQDLEEMGPEIVNAPLTSRNARPGIGVIDNPVFDNTEQIRTTAAIAKPTRKSESA